MKIKPLHDQVLIKQHKSELMSKGGLYIPTTAQEKLLQGEVLAIGSGTKLENGTVQPMSVNPGDVVMFSPYGFVEVKIDGEDYIMLKEEHILAVVEK